MFGDGFPFGRAAINSHVYRLRTDGRVSQEFLYFWLASEPILLLMRRLGTGAAIPGIPRRNLLTIPIPLPVGEKLAAFQAVGVPSSTRIFANAKESRCLAQLRDALLPKLISGEIRVPEAERAVEAVL
jgi:type I restriction enzyme S subunit